MGPFEIMDNDVQSGHVFKDLQMLIKEPGGDEDLYSRPP